MKRLLKWLSWIWTAECGRPIAGIMLAGSALMLYFPDIYMSPYTQARLGLFDQYQSLLPRHPQSAPVVIVEIDEATLGALGQWPWPRNYLAALIDAVAGLKPAAVGLDIIMPEPDHASPQAVAESRPDLPENVRATLTGAASNDDLLATSLAGAPIVLGAAGFPVSTSGTIDHLPTNAVEVRGDDPLSWLNSYLFALASLPKFQAAAHGQALLSGDPENGVMRRVPELSNLNGKITPGLSLEMLRIAHGVPNIVVDTGAHGVKAANIGALHIPLQGNGEAWVHFDNPSRQHSISALSLLKNEVPSERIAGKMVLIGLTGLGLQDMVTSPSGDRRSGLEVHAQLIESFEDGHFLRRPWWLFWAEMGILIGFGLLIIWVVPDVSPRKAAKPGAGQNAAAQRPGAEYSSAAPQNISQGDATPRVYIEKRSRDRTEKKGLKAKAISEIPIILLFLLFGAGFALFYFNELLFDAAGLYMGLNTVYGSLFSSNFIRSKEQRNKAERALQESRMKAAKEAGALDAARRIQLSTLPAAATAFPGETRFEIDAVLEPACEAGGDLFDFFMIDERHLFFVIGDVSGSGFEASLFMVITKTLAKSVTLKSTALQGRCSLGEIITLVNMEMVRENQKMLFVTAVAGILDIESGALQLVNAGHFAPIRIGADGKIESVKGDGGPPLCVLDDFVYPVDHLQLVKGDTLLLFTDGLLQAANINDGPYSMTHIDAVLSRTFATDQHPAALVSALREDVHTIVPKLPDDLTILVLRWQGTT